MYYITNLKKIRDCNYFYEPSEFFVLMMTHSDLNIWKFRHITLPKNPLKILIFKFRLQKIVWIGLMYGILLFQLNLNYSIV